MLHCYENVKYSNKMNSQKGKKHKNQIKKKKIIYYYMSKCCNNSLNAKNKR